MATADYYYPDWECLVDFFCNLGLKNCWQGLLGIEPTTTTLDLSSQSGAYDLSATATPEAVNFVVEAIRGQRLTRGAEVWTHNPLIPSPMPRRLGHDYPLFGIRRIHPFINARQLLTIKETIFCFYTSKWLTWLWPLVCECLGVIGFPLFRTALRFFVALPLTRILVLIFFLKMLILHHLLMISLCYLFGFGCAKETPS